MKRLREIIGEEIASQETLHPKSQAYDDLNANANKALLAYQALNQQQKQRHRDMVLAMLDDSAWRKPGGGIADPENAAKKNRSSILSKEEREAMDEEEREAMDFFTQMNLEQRERHLAIIEDMVQKEELSEALEGIGFTEENQSRVEKLFHEAVERNPLKRGLLKLLREYSPSPFISTKQIDVIEMLAEKIQELEEAIADTEQDSQELREEIRLANRAEKLKQQQRKEARVPKKSRIEETLEFVDPDSQLMGESEKYVDSRMREYLRFFPRYKLNGQ